MAKFSFRLAAVLAVFVFCLHIGQPSGLAAPQADNLPQLAGKNIRIGVETGDVFDKLVEDVFAPSTPVYFTAMAEAFAAVLNGQVDAVIFSTSYYGALKDAGVYGQFDYYELPAEQYELTSAQVFWKAALRDEWNSWLAEKTADGSLKERFKFWTENDLPAPDKIPVYTFSGEKGVLRVGDTGNYPPYSYLIGEDRYAGYDTDLVNWFASERGYTPEWSLMSYDALVPSVSAGKSDMSGASFVDTAERRKQLLFGEPTAWTRAVVATRKKTPEPAAGTSNFNRTEGLTWKDFIGKKFAVVQGSMHAAVAEDMLKDRNPLLFDDDVSMFEAVRLGKAEAALSSIVSASIFISSGNPEFRTLDVPSDNLDTAVGAISADKNLIAQYNIFLAGIKADGTLDDMIDRWMLHFNPSQVPEIPDIKSAGKNGRLLAAIENASPPYSFISNGRLTGFEVEHMLRFAAYLEKNVEFSQMSFAAVLPSIMSGKCDISASGIAITEERRRNVAVSDPYFYENEVVVYVPAESPAKIQAESPAGVPAKRWEDFIGSRFAIQTGSVYDSLAKDLMKDPAPIYYEDASQILDAVRLGKAEATISNSDTLNISLENFKTSLASVRLPEEKYSVPTGIISLNKELLAKYNQFLAQIKADGTLDDMKRRWIYEFDQYNPPAMPDIPVSGENGTLKIATTVNILPFTMLSNDEVIGFEIEHMKRFAQYLGMKPEFSVMQLNALLPAVVSGVCDVGASAISITEERAKSVSFSDSYYEETASVIYRIQPSEDAAGFSISEWLKEAVQKNLVTEDRWKLIAAGLFVTMQIALLSQLFSTLFAFPLCFLLIRKRRIFRLLGRLYCGLIYGLPAITLLLISYYIIFGKSSVNPIYIAVAAFSLICAADIASSFAQSIGTVNKTEIEAARAIGFSSFGAFWLIVFPQALKQTLPSYTVGFVQLVKSTALVGFIAIQDMTRAADIIRSRTFDAYFPILFTALIYLVITTVCVVIFNFFLKCINAGNVSK
jgi:polar amino acid transport system substrate-binding protein